MTWGNGIARQIKSTQLGNVFAQQVARMKR